MGALDGESTADRHLPEFEKSFARHAEFLQLYSYTVQLYMYRSPEWALAPYLLSLISAFCVRPLLCFPHNLPVRHVFAFLFQGPKLGSWPHKVTVCTAVGRTSTGGQLPYKT